jgi:hypothetical protein
MMKRAAHIITNVAFGLMVAFVVLGSLFVAGYAFDDPGGWAAVGLVALWLVPMLVLVGVAARWPSVAVWVMAGALVLFAAYSIWYALDTQWWRDVMDDVGPVLGISTFVLALPLAVLGLHRQLTAGLLLVAAAVIPYVAFLVSVSDEPWRGIADSLTTSSTVSCLPVFTVGVLFLVAGFLGRLGSPAPPETPPPAPLPPVGAGASSGSSSA